MPAANSFLKTLEEPPPSSIFFLIGTSPERQLPTIVSRCQVVRFRPLPDAVVAGILRLHEITDESMLARLVHLGRGSPGQALALADQELWDFRKVLIMGLLHPRPDSVALSKQLMEFVQDAGKETAAQRRRANQILRLLIEFLDDALAVRLGASPRVGDAEELATLRKLADRVDPEKLLRILERCLEADMQTGRYLQLVLVLEGLMDALGTELGHGLAGIKHG
jgi:DNA polymerase-3 subunit delta'